MKTIAVFMVLPAICVSAMAQPGIQGQTILDGVYSEAQTARGGALYGKLCATCHGNALEGVSAPELTGNRFISRWREGTLDGIYNFVRQRMPLGRSPGASPIPDDDYLDIVTYVLKANDYPSGPSELVPDLLSKVMFVGKNGPQPVPDGALVITVGCLSQTSNGTWILLSATEPARTRIETSSPQEVKTSAEKGLGTLAFRLAEIDAVPEFEPDMHKGHKMQAKGYLVRQPNAERISLSSMEMLDATCVP